jgi:hypothetical protein
LLWMHGVFSPLAHLHFCSILPMINISNFLLLEKKFKNPTAATYAHLKSETSIYYFRPMGLHACLWGGGGGKRSDSIVYLSLPIALCPWSTAYYLPPSTHCLLLIAHFLLFTANHQLSIVHCNLQPTFTAHRLMPTLHAHCYHPLLNVPMESKRWQWAMFIVQLLICLRFFLIDNCSVFFLLTD